MDYFFFFFLFIIIHFFVVVVVELTSRLFFQKKNRHVHSLVHKYVALKHGSINRNGDKSTNSSTSSSTSNSGDNTPPRDTYCSSTSLFIYIGIFEISRYRPI